MVLIHSWAEDSFTSRLGVRVAFYPAKALRMHFGLPTSISVQLSLY